MNKKKLLTTLIAGTFITIGIVLYIFNSAIPVKDITPPSGQPGHDVVYVQDQEFYNFSKELKSSTKRIDIKDHWNIITFESITDNTTINSIFDLISSVTTKSSADNLESIAKSQSDGNSFTISFINTDDTRQSIRVNIDLNIACINGEYYEVSKDFINTINQTLSGIPNIQDLNSPMMV